MKYALRFEPPEDLPGIDVPMWVWFQEHGTYFVERKEHHYPEGAPAPREKRPHYIVGEADGSFLDMYLQPEYTGSIERVSFDDLPDQLQGEDPRDILREPLWIEEEA